MVILHRALLGVATLALAGACAAQDMGKLLATGGVSQLEGAAGGGLTPWALIAGYGTRDSYGANVHYTNLNTQDYRLGAYGVAVGVADLVEFSLARQVFSGRLAPLNKLEIGQDIVGVKVKLLGDAVYGQDSLLPQLAVGAQFKRNGGVKGIEGLGVTKVTQLGAKGENGADVYVSATKIVLEHSLLLNATLRATKANQMGLLGFGGDKGDSRKAMFEGSAAYLVNRRWVAGVEYRAKPHNLGVDDEKDYYDAFVAYFPNKRLSVTAAYAVLGGITIFNPKRQRGLYLSAQAGF